MNTPNLSVCRRLLAGFAGAVLALALHAQNGLTAQALAQWNSTGGVQAVKASPGSVMLPAGGEISRSLDADIISLHLRSQPFFSTAAEGWPTVEIGPASLIFLRDENGGGTVLAGNQLHLLPFTVALGADGRSQQPLDFTFSFDRTSNVGALLFGGSTYTIPADSAADGPVRVAISAGGVTSWTLETLELVASSPADSGNDSKGGVGRAGNSRAGKPQAALPDANRAGTRKQARDQAKNLFKSGDDDVAEKALTDRNLNRKGTAEWHIESANELVQMAFSLSRAGKPDKAVRVARRALLHTSFAIQKASQPGLAAMAEEIAGFVQERFLANPTEAKARYQAGLQRLPGSGLKQSLDRLVETEAEAGRKRDSRGR